MIKNIFIIGDSQIAYASAGVKIPMNGKHLAYGSHSRFKSGYNLKFLWQTSRGAYKVDFDYLKDLFKNNIADLGEHSIIVSEFGGMDAVMEYNKKYKNVDEVMYKYTSEIIKFCKQYNTKLIFLCPWWMYEDDETYQPWEDLTVLLRTISKENALPEPIEVMYNVISRKYTTIDEFKHHTPEDSERIVDYVILKVDELYGS
jgi:hypothetical protein